jgi:hypothetical protein
VVEAVDVLNMAPVLTDASVCLLEETLDVNLLATANHGIEEVAHEIKGLNVSCGVSKVAASELAFSILGVDVVKHVSSAHGSALLGNVLDKGHDNGHGSTRGSSCSSSLNRSRNNGRRLGDRRELALNLSGMQPLAVSVGATGGQPILANGSCEVWEGLVVRRMLANLAVLTVGHRNGAKLNPATAGADLLVINSDKAAAFRDLGSTASVLILLVGDLGVTLVTFNISRGVSTRLGGVDLDGRGSLSLGSRNRLGGDFNRVTDGLVGTRPRGVDLDGRGGHSL